MTAAVLKIVFGWVVGLLRAIPPRVWLVLLFLGAVAAAVLYAGHREDVAHKAGLREGRAEVQGRWDEAVRLGREEIARLDRENAAKDERARLEAQHIGESRERDHAEDLRERDRLAADLRTGNVRLRQQWRACLSGSQAAGASPVPGGPVQPDPLRGADAGDMAGAVAESAFMADDADSRVRRLIQFAGTLRAACATTEQ